MANQKNFVKDVMRTIASEFEKNNISSKYDTLSKHTFSDGQLSLEDAQLRNQATDTVSSLIDQSLNRILTSEEYAHQGVVLTEAQRAAAKMVVSLAADPKNYAANMNNLKQVQTYGSAVTDVNAGSLGIEDFADVEVIAGELSREAYDGQKLNNAIFFSIAFNIGATRQDEFAEAFFPTITIDPAQSGINVSIDCATVFNEYNRETTGAANADKFKRSPVVKSIFDEKLFTSDKHRLVPVVRTGVNDTNFMQGVTYVENVSGQDITTAPLLFNTTYDLIGISATDDILAKGVPNNTDALDRTIKLSKIFYKINNDVFAIDPSIYAFHNFIYNPQGHHKALQLNFSTNVAVNISEVKQYDGTDSTEWAAVTGADNYKAIFALQLVGNANTFDGTVEVNNVKLSLVEVRDAAGQKVATTEQAYTDIKAVADKATLEGYVLEASRTNSNVRTRGVLVTNDRYEYRYDVPFRSGISALYPIQNAGGDDNDVNSVSSQILLAGVIISNCAVKTLEDYAGSLNIASANGLLETGEYASGIARHLVEPYFNLQSFELASVVDSLNSSTRNEDIRSALLNIIRTEVVAAYLQSNYGVAHDVIRGNVGGKVAVVIGTDPLLKSLLVKDEDVFALDTTFEAHVVATKNPKVNGKIYVTFGVFDANRNSAPNPLNFGNNVWAPTISYEVTKTDGGSVSRELHNNPRFAHIIHLPILMVFNVTDVAEVFKKIPVHEKSMAVDSEFVYKP